MGAAFGQVGAPRGHPPGWRCGPVEAVASGDSRSGGPGLCCRTGGAMQAWRRTDPLIFFKCWEAPAAELSDWRGPLISSRPDT